MSKSLVQVQTYSTSTLYFCTQYNLVQLYLKRSYIIFVHFNNQNNKTLEKNLTSQFNDHLIECLEKEENSDRKEIYNINVENIEYLA